MIDVVGLPEEIIELYELNKHLEISEEEFLSTHLNKENIHNHTYENLTLYFHLDKFRSKNRVVFFYGGVWIVDNRKHKFFIYDNPSFFEFFNLSPITEELKKKFIFYTSSELEILTTSSSLKLVLSKMKEMNYNVESIIGDKENKIFWEKYQNKKEIIPNSKIKKRIDEYLHKPIRKFNKWVEGGLLEIVDYNESHHNVMNEIHDSWVEYKMNDPKVFKMMFSSGRYNRCLERMFVIGRDKFYAKVIYFEGKPVAILQCLLKGEQAYGISFFSKFWETPSQFTQMLFSWYLRDLYETYGIKRLAYGMEVDKNLHNWKAHFPYEYGTTYKYNLN